jgi:CDP-diacylglycerol--glycerol-3-phosphate 3-phosphatidyltransferase
VVKAPALPDEDAYLRLWSELHGGYDPRAARSARIWLGAVYRCGVPLARRRVSPGAVTLVGVLLAVAMLGPAAAGGRWPLLAAVLLVANGLSDSLDGCVALLTGRATRWGYVFDSVADRISDALIVVALWLAGGSAALCLAAGSLAALQEYTRARAGQIGFQEIGVVTVAERPTRIIVGALGLAAAGVVPSHAGSLTTAAAVALVCLGAVGCGQLVIALWRALRSQAGPMSSATMRADSVTSGSPPPGCADPPTR